MVFLIDDVAHQCGRVERTEVAHVTHVEKRLVAGDGAPVLCEAHRDARPTQETGHQVEVDTGEIFIGAKFEPLS